MKEIDRSLEDLTIEELRELICEPSSKFCSSCSVIPRLDWNCGKRSKTACGIV